MKVADQVDSDGWFPTRDAGSLDEDSFLFSRDELMM